MIYPVDPPREDLSHEELTLWARKFSEQFNLLLDQLNGMRQAGGGADGSALASRPVGSLYVSSDPTPPEKLFGGKWQREYGFIYCADESHPAGSTGGEEMHTLTVNEMPSHSHKLGIENPDGQQTGGSKLKYAYNPTAIYYGGADVIETAGDGQAHNNMPPYTAYYAWKRIA